MTTHTPSFGRAKRLCRQRLWRGILLGFGFFLLSGCNQPFDPRAPYQDHLVVYSILSNDRDQQYLRLYTTYNPPDFDPNKVTADQQIIGATVLLAQSGGPSVQFHDTVFARPDTSRYGSLLHAYVIPLRPGYGMTYQISIQAQGGLAATGSLSLPDKAYLSYSGISILQRPGDLDKAAISVYTTLSGLAGGYVVRMVLQYLLSDGMTSLQETREVPIAFRNKLNNDGTVSPDLDQPIFPLFRRVQSNAVTTSFASPPYLSTLIDIQKQNIGKSITFQRAIFLVMQADQNFFKYYSITNGFQDSVSIRLDQPLYSNITGGTGLFGGYTIDTLSYSYESTFFYNR